MNTDFDENVIIEEPGTEEPGTEETEIEEPGTEEPGTEGTEGTEETEIEEPGTEEPGTQQTVYQETQTVDYSQDFLVLENLGYVQVSFMGALLFYFVLSLVYKFIKSFF